MKPWYYNYDKLRAELKKLLRHPTFSFLEAEAQHFGYSVKQKENDCYSFYVANRVFCRTENFCDLAEDFLANKLLADFAEYATERITQKRQHGLSNAKTFYEQFKTNLYKQLDDIQADDFIYLESEGSEMLIYEEPDPMLCLWSAYEILENFALSLHNVTFVRTHRDLRFAFEIYIDAATPFTFYTIDARSLQRCFVTLCCIYFNELIADQRIHEARQIEQDIITPYLLAKANKATPAIPNIMLNFNYDERAVSCFMLNNRGCTFHRYDFSDRSLTHLIQNINDFISVNGQLDSPAYYAENAAEMKLILKELNKFSANLQKFVTE